MLLALMLVFGLLTGVTAASRNRSPIAWFFVGAITPLVGMILAVNLPALPGPNDPKPEV